MHALGTAAYPGDPACPVQLSCRVGNVVSRVVVLALALAFLGVAWSADWQTRSEIVVHSGLAAGLAHHDAKAVWDALRVGDALALVREPANLHDANAVRIEWRGRLLGYLPRADNAAIARQLDRGNPLQARVAQLGRYRNHRLRLRVDVYVPL